LIAGQAEIRTHGTYEIKGTLDHQDDGSDGCELPALTGCFRFEQQDVKALFLVPTNNRTPVVSTTRQAAGENKTNDNLKHGLSDKISKYMH
jgi:hypothetical protein